MITLHCIEFNLLHITQPTFEFYVAERFTFRCRSGRVRMLRIEVRRFLNKEKFRKCNHVNGEPEKV